MRITEAGAAAALLEQVAAGGGNLLIVGRPGSGKTTLLKRLVTAAPGAGARRYRFFFDLAVKGRAETFPGFVTRTLGPCMAVEAVYVFPALCYFARAGSVLCALDGVDEAVPQLTQAGFLDLFAELSQVLSAESAVVMTSRVSFLEDSSQVRRLLDGTTLMSEKLVQQVHAEGVNPLAVPRFSVLRLHDEPSGRTPLETQLVSLVTPAAYDDAAGRGGSARPAAPPHQADLGHLPWQPVTVVVDPELPRAAEAFGPPSLRVAPTFTRAEPATGLA